MRIFMVVAMLLGVMLAGVGAGRAMAQWSGQGATATTSNPFTGLPGTTGAPTIAQAPAADRLDAQTVERSRSLAEGVAEYVSRGPDGKLVLADVEPSRLGVSQQLLSDFRAALDEINAAIDEGMLSVDADLRLRPTDLGKQRAKANIIAGRAARLPETAQPDWGATWYGYGGILLYMSPFDCQGAYYQYAPMCAGMAAYLGRPYLARNFGYLYVYNPWMYSNRYCFQPYTWYCYVPYSYCGSSFGYKPAWLWQWSYVSSCRCYRWGWQGYWVTY
jgi:hypothetical protein